jgi:uncharacterized protein (TIGR02588 family)
MKLTSPFKDFTTTDYYLFGLFVLYLVVPFRTPHMLHDFLVGPIGLILLLCAAVSMFFMSPSILAIIFVLVIYEILRRDSSSSTTYRETKHVTDNRTQQYKYATDNVVNTSVESMGQIANRPTVQQNTASPKHDEVKLYVGDSLEENVIGMMAPIDYGTPKTSADFKPVSENIMNASVF